MYYNQLSIKSDKLFDYLLNLPHESLPWSEHFGFDAFEIDLSWIDKDAGLTSLHKMVLDV